LYKKKKKTKKYICVKYDDILEHFWKSVSKFQGIKGQNYDSNKFSNNKAIIMLSLKYPQFNLGFFVDYMFSLWYINTILLLLLEWIEFQKIVPRLTPVVAKVSIF